MIVICGLVLSSGVSQAADIRPADRPECGISLSGDIEAGDYDRFVAAARGASNRRVCLSSPGGSWTEGVRIAEYVMDSFLGTYVGAGKECSSACAIVFLAGARKSRTINTDKNGRFDEDFHTAEYFRIPNRTMHVTAKIGFHAPYLTLKEETYSAGDVQTSRIAALKAYARFLGMMGQEKDIPNAFNFIPKRFVARAMKMKRDELMTVDTVDTAGWLGVDLDGYRLPKKITKHELFWVPARQQVWKYRDSLAEEFFAKMSTPGQPIKYEKPTHYSNKSNLTRAIYNVYLNDTESSPDFYVELDTTAATNPLLYTHFYAFGQYAEGANGYPVEVVTEASDKRRLMGVKPGMIERLRKAGHEHLLTPIWQAYPAKTKLVDIAKD
ncbi:MAG: hypothetical protein KJ867_01390 [Gammaproteobacteria bacterium]|nr:hypothetical protein [Gammaproteobacteria bacterium]